MEMFAFSPVNASSPPRRRRSVCAAAEDKARLHLLSPNAKRYSDLPPLRHGRPNLVSKDGARLPSAHPTPAFTLEALVRAQVSSRGVLPVLSPMNATEFLGYYAAAIAAAGLPPPPGSPAAAKVRPLLLILFLSIFWGKSRGGMLGADWEPPPFLRAPGCGSGRQNERERQARPPPQRSHSK